MNPKLPTKNRASPLRRRRRVRNPIRRLRKNSRTIRRRRRTIRIRRRIRETESVLTERISVDLAQIIANLPIALIRVLKLQDVGRAFIHGDLERMASVGRGTVGFGVCTGVGGEGVGVAAAGGMLDADDDVGFEGALVDDEGLARGAGAGAGCV